MSKASEILNKVKVALGMEIQLAQMKLQDGVTILEAESFEAGYSVGVVAADGIVPAPIGEYTLEDGRVLVVEQEGIIKEIKEVQMNAEPPAPAEPAPAKPSKVVETVSKETFFAEIEALKKENTELKAQIVELSKVDLKAGEAAAEPIAFNPEVKLSQSSDLFSKKGNLNEFLNAKIGK